MYQTILPPCSIHGMCGGRMTRCVTLQIKKTMNDGGDVRSLEDMTAPTILLYNIYALRNNYI